MVERTSGYSLPMYVPGSDSLPGIEAPSRGPTYGRRFAIATDHPTASLVGMNILQRGGNAADAAIAVAAVNAVTKPERTSLGGDAFFLVWRRGPKTVDALNAGGRAPLAATTDRYPNGIPVTGPNAPSVPGLVDAMLELYASHATLPLATLLGPAIDLAENGYPTSQKLSGAMSMIPSFKDDWAAETRRVFLVDGERAYRPGELFRQPELAEVLKRIVEDEREGFYEGETASLLTKGIAAAGGIIETKDFEATTAHWAEPIQSTYAGCDIYEQALPSQGIILLEALNIAEHFPLADWGFMSDDAQHVLIEASKLAFADSQRYNADPDQATVPLEVLLSKEHARERAALIDLKQAKAPGPAAIRSDTTQFVVGDEELGIAFIQSVFSPWGSRFTVPGTGILMNNRLRGFNLDPTHPNALVPGKRTVHTLNTFMAIRDGRMAIGGGTPGGDFQVQTNLQTILGALTWGMDLQGAIDYPRWVNLPGNLLAIEQRYAPSTVQSLIDRGHDVRVLAGWDGTVARSQVMSTTDDGGWAVASDMRGEGVALAH